MKKIKRFLFVLILGIVLLDAINYNHVNAATVSEAMNWCESLLGKKVGSGQCVALIQNYYEYLGKSKVSGNACDYATNALPSGWSRVKGGTPQTGDILVYVGAKYGHVAIYAGGTTSYHQNMSGQYVEKKTNWAYNKSWYSRAEGGTKSYWGYIRPAFDNNPEPTPSPITTTPSIWKDRDNYTVGDAVKFTWNRVDHATGYWFVVWYKGEQIVTTQVSGSSEYTLYNLREGDYTAFITAYNDTNSKENSISLSVRYPDGYEAISNGKYQICSALDNSSVVSIASASQNDEANALLYANEHHTNQIFNFENLGNGYYKIIAEHSGKSLDVYNNENKSGANVQQYSWNNNENQQWVIREAGDGYFYIISKGNGLYLDVYEGVAKNDANIDTYSGHGGTSEKWSLIPCLEGTKEIEDGAYRIQSALDSSYGLNVAGGSKADEANVQLGLVEDYYQVTFCEDGSYKIINVNSQKSLDAYSSDSMKGKKKGTNVQQFYVNGNDNQKWIIKSAGNGQYYVICKSNGLYLDVYGGKKQDGANIDLWVGNGNTCQKWIFVPAKKDLSSCDVSLSKDTYFYDGKEKTPDVTIKNGEVTLEKDSDYSVSYADNINAGTATVTITGIGKYTGKITKQFKINKVSQNLIITIDKTNISIGENVQIKADGQGQIIYESSAEDKVTVSSDGMITGKQAGEAIITVTASGTQNYNSATKKLTINVQNHKWDANEPTLSLVEKNGILVAAVSNMAHVTEYGFVYGKQTDVTLETPGRTRITYSELDADGSYFFDATELTGCMIKAYVVYTDENGSRQVIYSDLIS